MRVDFHYGQQSVSESEQRQTQSAPSQVETCNDQAQLSGAHVQIEALTAQAAQLPEVRQERVQSLREAIQNGEYRTDPEQLAGALLAHMTSGSAA